MAANSRHGSRRSERADAVPKFGAFLEGKPLMVLMPRRPVDCAASAGGGQRKDCTVGPRAPDLECGVNLQRARQQGRGRWRSPRQARRSRADKTLDGDHGRYRQERRRRWTGGGGEGGRVWHSGSAALGSHRRMSRSHDATPASGAPVWPRAES